MEKEDLLDARVRQDLAFIQYLYTHNGHATRKQMALDLQVDPRLIADHMAILGDQLNSLFPDAPFHLGPPDAEYILDLINLPTLEDVTNLLIRDGSAYQILVYIFWHNDFTMTSLQRELLMSSSTLFRHVGRLNELLAQFHLAIRNNRLQGREVDIRHFYFLLFSVVNDRDERLTNTNNPQIEQFITDLQNSVTGPLPMDTRQSVRIYLHLLLQRVAVNQPLNDDTGGFRLATIKELPGMAAMFAIWGRLFTRNNHINPEFEGVAFFVFAFYAHVFPLDSELYHTLFLLTNPFSSRLRSYVHAVMDLLSSKFDLGGQQRELQLIFFTELTTMALLPGAITNAHQLVYTAMQGIYWKPESGQMQFIHMIISRLQRLSPAFSAPGAEDMLVERLTMTVLLLLVHTRRQFRIGLVTTTDLATNYYMRRGISQQVSANFNVSVSNYDSTEQYDIIVTTSVEMSNHIGLKNDLPLIQMQDFGTGSDFVLLYWYLDALVSNYLKTDLPDP
ncbi:helix-turn-helix domain-containing protein [Schleiferilactobacillus shenzhenensis]|nr:helix-turn-helix domain-containing protein [Schleiferilactobacillus shenzhenensis]